MKSMSEFAKDLGPGRRQELQQLEQAAAARTEKVATLSALCEGRRSELVRAAPAEVTSASDPGLLMMAPALSKVVSAIEEELSAARAEEQVARAALNSAIDGVLRHRQRVAELSSEIGKLAASKEKLLQWLAQ